MWITSKSLLRSWNGAPDTAALEWDSSELSEICAQSLTRRSNFSAAKSWRAVWKRGKSTLPRYGRILKPSHANAFEEWWTSSLPATPASPSARRGKGKAKKTQGTSGPSSKGQLVMFDLTGSSARTSQATLPSALKTQYATTWTNWVTKLRRDCSRREEMRACRTRDNDSSSWPTIRAQEPGWTSEGYGDNLMKRMARMRSSEVWPTPTEMSRVRDDAQMQKCLDFRATKGKNSVPLYLEETVMLSELTSPPPDPERSNTGGNPPECWLTITQQCDMETNGPKGNQGTYLLGAVKESWPTPRAQENDEPPEKWEKRRKEKEAQGINLHLPLSVKAKQEQESWATPRVKDSDGWRMNQARAKAGKPEDTLTGQAIDRGKVSGMKLSPRWVEALMGLPIGWTDPTCSRPISPWEAVYTAASMNSEPSEME